MFMWGRLSEELRETAQRRVLEHERYRQVIRDENNRRRRRTTAPLLELDVQLPETWKMDTGYDPFHVRARHRSIAYSVTQELRNGSYRPARPAGFEIAKASGGTRIISQFRVVDEVISLRLFRSLMDKNRSLLSARAYAYRHDLSPHDALAHISREFAREQRVFVAEYDFSKFFDTISHDYLRSAIDALGLRVTPLERRLIDAFLSVPKPYLTPAEKGAAVDPRVVGIPQGTSLSLFLANVAAAELDRSLERLGVGFVRYADDTLIWSHTYSEISEAVDALHAASAGIGSEINLEKSSGVRLLLPQGTGKAEMSYTHSVPYLGHDIGLRRLSMKSTAVERLKTRINELIFANLLREPLRGTQSFARLSGTNDKDYVTYVWQLRRYLYGSLSENQVRRFQHGAIPGMSFEGAMSYFPLVDDDAQLAEIDAWIASQAWLAVRKRERLLKPRLKRSIQPWGLSKEELIGLTVTSATSHDPVDLRMPSVRRISRAIRQGVEAHGLRVVRNLQDPYLYQESH
ncbi:reverse transcriptase domain-containing protein [Mycetocola zhadangensis]|uniref:reverse transcriptase domain-containing protein n=1 Tax=Mycetocola zhadangensis TaxID=1164595 RepID=UPI003A4DE7E2